MASHKPAYLGHVLGRMPGAVQRYRSDMEKPCLCGPSGDAQGHCAAMAELLLYKMVLKTFEINTKKNISP